MAENSLFDHTYQSVVQFQSSLTGIKTCSPLLPVSLPFKFQLKKMQKSPDDSDNAAVKVGSMKINTVSHDRPGTI